jgi:hypothetical protein
MTGDSLFPGLPTTGPVAGPLMYPGDPRVARPGRRTPAGRWSTSTSLWQRSTRSVWSLPSLPGWTSAHSNRRSRRWVSRQLPPGFRNDALFMWAVVAPARRRDPLCLRPVVSLPRCSLRGRCGARQPRQARCAARGCGWLRSSLPLRCAPWRWLFQVGTGKQALPRDSKVVRSATRRMAGLAGLRSGYARPTASQTGGAGFHPASGRGVRAGRIGASTSGRGSMCPDAPPLTSR